MPSSGGFSRTISVRESGMPQTVSKNSPSTNVLPSTSRPSATRHRALEQAALSPGVGPAWLGPKVRDASARMIQTSTWRLRRTCMALLLAVHLSFSEGEL